MGFAPLPPSTPHLTPLSTSSLELGGEPSARSAYVSSNDSLLFSDLGGVPVLGEFGSSSRRGIDNDLVAQLRRDNSASDISTLAESDVHRAFAASTDSSSKHSTAIAAGRLRTTACDIDTVVSLCSRAHAALAFHSVAAGFCITFLRYGFRPLLVAYLSLHHPAQFTSARYLLEWPSACGVFIGLASDCCYRTFSGYRRKPFVVLGWLTSLLASLGIVVTTLLAPAKLTLFSDATKRGDAVATADLEPDPAQFATLYVTFSCLISLGLTVAWIASLATTVELAQREPLAIRGRIQGTFLLLFYSAALVAQSVVACVLFPSIDATEPLRATLTIGEAGVVLATVSAVALPIVWCFLTDERLEDVEALAASNAPVVRRTLERLYELVQLCEQQAMYRLLTFEISVVLVLGLYNTNVRDAIATWSTVTPAATLVVQVAASTSRVVGLALWRFALLQTSWRTLVIAGVALYVGCSVALAVPTALDALRSFRLFLLLTAALDVPRAWLKVFALAPATEIAARGREGATVGLIVSFQWLAGRAAHALSAALSAVIGTNVTATQVRVDANATRHAVVAAALVYAVVNASSVALAALLPKQKAEAQLLRHANRCSRAAGVALALLFVGLLGYSLVANIVILRATTNDS